MGDGLIRVLGHPDGPYLLRQLAIAGRAGKRGAQRWDITLKTPMASIVGSTLAVALIPASLQSNPPGMVTQMIVAGVMGEPWPPASTTSDLYPTNARSAFLVLGRAWTRCRAGDAPVLDGSRALRLCARCARIVDLSAAPGAPVP